MTDIFYTREYDTIKSFYGTRCAKRSGVPLMNHIDEGLFYLQKWGRSLDEQKAYAIHPIVQNNEDVDVSWSSAFKLAEEYRDRANSYLCTPNNFNITDVGALVDKMSIECAYMLLADKIQNQKDFLIYHLLTHPKSDQLRIYFQNWINYLVNEYGMSKKDV